MKLQLKGGIEIEVSDGLNVKVSEDGVKVTITGPAPEVIEKIRIVEVAGPETIRYVPQITYTDPQPYIPNVPYYPTYPTPAAPGTPWPGTYPTGPNWIWTGGTISGGLRDNSFGGLGGGGSISDQVTVGDVGKITTTTPFETGSFTTGQFLGSSGTATA